MAKPTSSFSFISNGLSVTFTDRSSGIINSWVWDFGFQEEGVEKINNTQTPPAIVFPAAGKYQVSLATVNGEGTSIYTIDLYLSDTPGLNLGIQQLVQNELPGNLAFDNSYFGQRLRKWQLFLQPLVSPKIEDADVFNETKWPPLANVLIAKLIIYDLIQQAANSSMSAFLAAENAYSNLAGQITTTTIPVSDYSVGFNFENPTTINMIMIDGVSFGVSPIFTTVNEMLIWLNGLGKGTFAINGVTLESLGNSHVITGFSYTQSTGVNAAFSQGNTRIIGINTLVHSSGGTSGLGKGPLKHIETGPSKVEWYDGSAFWSNILKGFTTDGKSGGIIGLLIQDICLYARRLNIYNLEMCKFKRTGSIPFIIT